MSMRKALSDIRIVDLTRAMAGPFATMMLADMGAEVIKVEHPQGGDTTRNTPHTFHPEDEKKYFGGYFNSVNRNKKSIAIDLKTEEGVALVKDLVADADVFIENFKRDVPHRLGLDYETLSKENPQIIYSSVSGFGDSITTESPHQSKPAFDVNAQALGGAMYITSPNLGGHPTKIGPGIGDIVPAMFNAFGIMTALWHREKTDEGQYVDVAMYDAVIALCERIIYTYSYQDEIETPAGNAQPLFAPFGIFEAKDGHVTVAATAPHQWESLCKYMGREDLADDSRFKDAGTRADHYDEFKEILENWTTQHTKEEIFETISEDVPCGPVNNAADIFQDPHVAAREMLAKVEQPTGNGGSVEVEIANTPLKLSETPGGVERRAPRLGEHADELLAELGFSTNEIEQLYEEDIIMPYPYEGGGGW